MVRNPLMASCALYPVISAIATMLLRDPPTDAIINITMDTQSVDRPRLIAAPRSRTPPIPPIHPRTAHAKGDQGEVLVRTMLNFQGTPSGESYSDHLVSPPRIALACRQFENGRSSPRCHGNQP